MLGTLNAGARILGENNLFGETAPAFYKGGAEAPRGPSTPLRAPDFAKTEAERGACRTAPEQWEESDGLI